MSFHYDKEPFCRIKPAQATPRRGAIVLRWALVFAGVLVVSLGMSRSVGATHLTDQEDIPTVALQRVTADAQSIVFELAVPEYGDELVIRPDGRRYHKLSVPGFESVGAPGWPELPVYSRLLAVPPGASLKLETQVLAERVTSLNAPVYPAPRPVAVDSDPGTESSATSAPNKSMTQFVIDPQAYSIAPREPAPLALLEDAGYVRDVRLARLTIYPLQYLASEDKLRHIQRMRLMVRFVGSWPSAPSAATPDIGEFVRLVQQTVLNPDQVLDFRSIPARASAAPSAPVVDQPRYRVLTTAAGIYQLTYADLVAAGISLNGLDPRAVRLYRGEQELAIQVIGQDDGRFDPADSIRFYNEQTSSLYTDVSTLWLSVGSDPGRRMAERSVTPTGAPPAPSFSAIQRFEQNKIYRSVMPAASDVDHWYWGQMFRLNTTTVPTLTAPFTIEHPLPVGPAALRLELWGGSSDASVALDHHVRVFVNDVFVGDVRWDGAVQYVGELPIDPALLQPGLNVLALNTPGDTGARDAAGRFWEANWLDAFVLNYQAAYRASAGRLAFTPPAGPGEFDISGWAAPNVLLYDVSDPLAPVVLTDADVASAGEGYTVRLADSVALGSVYYASDAGALGAPTAIAADTPSQLRAPAAGADYLIIVHSDFLAGIAPLAQFRREQGLRVSVIDVQDVYDEFSAGQLDPHAIRDFIRFAYRYWPGAPPAYVLLVGDGTYDFKDYEGYGALTFIPPFLAYADPVAGETATDNRYVTVAGDDLMPDLHLGRLPANNAAELAAMVNKIIAYEATPTPGAWRSTAVFVADNPDSAGQFTALSEAAAAYLPSELTQQKIYFGTAEYPLNQAGRAQQATLDAFNSGALLFNYVGHSSISNWASELLFGINALPGISNGSAYPIILPMTCLEGSYHNPRFTGAAESILRLAERGALASWSPTGLGVATGHDYLHRGLFDAIFNWDQRVLGPATTAAKLNLYANASFPNGAPRFRDLLDTYVLLGDPATRIGLPDAQLSIQATSLGADVGPGDEVRYAITYRNEGPVRVKRVVIDAELPEGLVDLAWQADAAAPQLRAGSRLTWDVAELMPGASGQMTVTGRIAEDLPPTSLPLSAEMSISSPWTESDTSDNRTGAIVLGLAPADLLLTQSTEPGTPVRPGEFVTFTLAYANLGPASASGTVLNLPVPVPLEDLQVSQTGAQAILRVGSTYEWNLATLRVGSKGRLVVRGRIPLDLAPDQTYWSVTGSIASVWPDADLSNNVGEAGVLTVLLGDVFEPDNNQGHAQRITVPLLAQQHTYDPAGDQDWVVFHAQAGLRYLIRTVNLSSGGDTTLALYDAAGGLLAKNDDAAPGTFASQLTWVAPADADFYVMFTSYTAAPGFSYGVELLPLTGRAFLPLP